MRVGVGYYNARNSEKSGRHIAREAMQAGGLKVPTFGLAFFGGSVDGHTLMRGVREVIGSQVPILGGAGIGLITNDLVSYEGYPAGLMLIEAPEWQIQVAAAGDLNLGGEQTARALASQLSPQEEDFMLLFYDSILKPPTNSHPPLMNSSRFILEGLQEAFPVQVPIIGGGTVGGYDFSISQQLTGAGVATQSAAAILLRGSPRVDWQVMHGCTPKDGTYHTITKIDGAVLQELDHKPAVEVINAMYGSTDWQLQMPLKRLTVGINLGDRFASSYEEKEHINRLILGVVPDQSGIVLFEPDLTEGMEIQFMLRDSVAMFESTQRNTDALLARVKEAGRRPVWGLYIDCAGRTASFSETIDEEADIVRKAFNDHDIPLLGFYSGVEIAPVQDCNRGLDWTGVLAIFSQDRHL